MLIKDDNKLLAIGMFSLALSVPMGFLHFEYLGFSVSDFVEGMLVGVSLVLNLFCLWRRREKKQA
jgi:hypothetical protein